MQTNRLDAHQLTHSYGQGDSEAAALADVSLSIGAEGPEAVAIMGPSGSGKSTLLHVLAGIIAPAQGRVVWRGQDLATMRDSQRTRLRRSDFGFVFQSGQLLPELPAIENVALPLMLGGGGRGAAEAQAGALLNRLGLGGMLARRPGELSGGQAQRVAIARALVGSPGIVFADEPTGALDRSTGQAVMSLLIGATLGHGASLVVVTHDPDVAAACSRVIRLEDGRIVSDGPASERADASAGAGALVPAGHVGAQETLGYSGAQAPGGHSGAQAPGAQAPGAQAPSAQAPSEHAPNEHAGAHLSVERWATQAPAHPAPYGGPAYAEPSYAAPRSASAYVVPEPAPGSYGEARSEQQIANPMQRWAHGGNAQGGNTQGGSAAQRSDEVSR